MKLLLSQEKGPIRRICEHWASFLDTSNELSNAHENPFPKGFILSLYKYLFALLTYEAFHVNSRKRGIFSWRLKS